MTPSPHSAKLQVSDEIRRPPDDPAAVAAELSTKHTEDELVKAHVLVPDPTDNLQLNPSLCQADTAIITLREREELDPFDLLTDSGTLTGRLLPVCASLRDGRIREMIKRAQENVLCVSSNSADVALLLSQNVPATFDAGLAQLGGVYLEQMRKDYKLDPSKREHPIGIIEDGDDQGDTEVLPDIICLGWSLASLSAESPPGLSDVVAHLTAVEDHLELCMDRLCCWQPEQKEIEQIAFCLDYGELKDVTGAIVESIRISSGQLIAPATTPEESPKDMAEAIEVFQRLRSRPERDREAERQAWKKLHALIEKGSIKPLFAAMEASKDPIERSHWLMAAMNAGVLYPQCARLLLRMTARAEIPGKLAAYPEPEFRQLMQATDRQRKIFKDIIEYRKDPLGNWK